MTRCYLAICVANPDNLNKNSQNEQSEQSESGQFDGIKDAIKKLSDVVQAGKELKLLWENLKGNLQNMANGILGKLKDNPDVQKIVDGKANKQEIEKFTNDPDFNKYLEDPEIAKAFNELLSNRKDSDIIKQKLNSTKKITDTSEKLTLVNNLEKQIDSAKEHGWNQNEMLLVAGGDSGSQKVIAIKPVSREDFNPQNPKTYELYIGPATLGYGGYGNERNTGKTPPGNSKLRNISERPANGKISTVFLRFEGLEGNNSNATTRGIGLHGTPSQQKLANGDKGSQGCLRTEDGFALFVAANIKKDGAAHVYIDPNLS